MRKLNKKGYQIRDLLPLVIAFVVIAIAISLGSQVIGDVAEDQCVDAGGSYDGLGCWTNTNYNVTHTTLNHDYNASVQGLESLEEFSDWLPTIALVVVIAVLLGILIFYLARRFA